MSNLYYLNPSNPTEKIYLPDYLLPVDNTLTQPGQAADAKAVGDRLASFMHHYIIQLGTTWQSSSDFYIQTINNQSTQGLLITDYPLTDIMLSDNHETAKAQKEAFSKIDRVVINNNSITVYAEEPISEVITIQMVVFR